MDPVDILNRVLNPAMLIAMAGAGIAYGLALWALNIHPASRLWAVGVMPGVVFLFAVWAVRAAQGVGAVLYAALIIDWVIFSSSGVVSVLVARVARRRP